MSPGPSSEDRVVRPALEAALAVAEAGMNEDPQRRPPRGLQAVLGFHKRPSTALTAVKRVLDRDDEFRELVAERTDTTALSSAAEAFLRRGEGWRDVVTQASRALDEAAADDRERDAERSAVELAAELRTRAEVAEAARTAGEAELKRLGDVERRLAAAMTRAAELESANEALFEERRRAVRELVDERRRLGERTAEVRELRSALAETERLSDVASQRGADQSADTPPGDQAADLEQQRDRADRAEAAGRSAAQEVQRLALELASLAERLNPGSAGKPAAAVTDNAVGRSADAGARRSPGASPRRRPVRVGRGLREGTTAATRALLETPGLVMWVDGYNVTMALWGDLALPAQREALVRSLSGVATACGTHIRVVFDGDTGGAPAVTAPLRVRVTFTEAGVEADDDIIDEVAATDPSIPVAVMSADRRVRDGVSACGANLLSPNDLRDLLSGARPSGAGS
jgi:predicted RNA-binding protein with PIN domain